MRTPRPRSVPTQRHTAERLTPTWRAIFAPLTTTVALSTKRPSSRSMRRSVAPATLRGGERLGIRTKPLDPGRGKPEKRNSKLDNGLGPGFPNRDQIKADFGGRGRVGQGADRDVVHAALGVGAEVVELEAAGGFYDGAALDEVDGEVDLLDRHVVEQDRVGAGLQGLAELGFVAHFGLDELAGAVLFAGAAHCLAHAAGKARVVFFDEPGVKQAEAVVRAAADAHGVALEQAQAGSGLAGVAQLRFRSLQAGDVAAGEGGDAAQALQEVERGALAAQERAGVAPHLGQHAAAHELAFFDQGAEAQLRVEQLEQPLHHRQARHHHHLLGEESASGLDRRGHGRVGGQVAGAQVFGQGALEDFGDFPNAPLFAGGEAGVGGRGHGCVSPEASRLSSWLKRVVTFWYWVLYSAWRCSRPRTTSPGALRRNSLSARRACIPPSSFSSFCFSLRRRATSAWRSAAVSGRRASKRAAWRRLPPSAASGPRASFSSERLAWRTMVSWWARKRSSTAGSVEASSPVALRLASIFISARMLRRAVMASWTRAISCSAL